jgi:hypothetical protein
LEVQVLSPALGAQRATRVTRYATAETIATQIATTPLMRTAFHIEGMSSFAAGLANTS